MKTQALPISFESYLRFQLTIPYTMALLYTSYIKKSVMIGLIKKIGGVRFPWHTSITISKYARKSFGNQLERFREFSTVKLKRMDKVIFWPII